MMLFTLPVAIVGYAVIANVASPHVRFGMTCIMAVGMYSSVPCVLVWNSNNSAGHYKRATTSALQLAIANCGGFVASEFFLSLSLLSLSLSTFTLPSSVQGRYELYLFCKGMYCTFMYQ